MNNIHFGLKSKIAVVALLLGSSCTDLKDESFDRIIANQFTPASGDVASLVGAAYTNWRDVMQQWNGLFRTQEISGDQLVIPSRPNGWVDGGVYRRIHDHKWTADDEIAINNWNRSYAGIANCNRLIYQIESGSIPFTDGKEAVIAELKVLRASYYYVLCDLFGNVPIITQFDVPAGFIPKQSTRKEVFDFIVKDILDNLPLLSEKNDPTTYGRFNKWGAHTLLAKMYLNAEVYTGTPAWEKCIEQCNLVINSGAGYALEATQKEVFKTNNESSKEIIFAIPFDIKYVTDWNGFSIHMETLQPANQATYNLLNTPWGGICAIPQFIDSFDKDDERLVSNWIQGPQYSAGGTPLKSTLGAFAGKPLSYINQLPGVDQSEEVHGFRLGKFEIEKGTTVNLSNDWPLLRYADVLLMKAESLLRTGKGSEAAAIVTTVRARNFKANPAKAVVTAADLQKGSTYAYGLKNHNTTTNEGGADIKYGRFLDELGWEFAQEGRRRQDLIRFGVFTTKSWLSHVPNGAYRSLLPIPRPELNKNSNLSQNNGY
ncbi:RagB/SusD family nutrient uptake outer membrane protein [Dyadobacter chenwenxiniae]|uniref:RagB/SusD family nutrient uptake outer membrane protein n=1 Tax=Dyadobacter chenwenxiniae TaxID=2906456 RepID=A0A9X1PMW5_9BACT|nr:RagB/SusD family nutrient uptake outer membrane protein [Dyadobacter chenwenxiniae]MCF0063229.1 RagB/SusD family nutrient uptake outer membrane protein [Dyadobacter chenwenxiniae]UON85391.1 RagB/SusD family nutrient uptake outer membrane protein [Dyadobacter chenwenxiniae]